MKTREQIALYRKEYSMKEAYKTRREQKHAEQKQKASLYSFAPQHGALWKETCGLLESGWHAIGYTFATLDDSAPPRMRLLWASDRTGPEGREFDAWLAARSNEKYIPVIRYYVAHEDAPFPAVWLSGQEPIASISAYGFKAVGERIPNSDIEEANQIMMKTLIPFAKEGCERTCLMSDMKSHGATISQQPMS